ncbi:MAG: methyltransferase domain-containing protein [Firmicutes bacterium]|nr:methyltransferase domain-containing protein [Bacillota bacterium]
MGKFDKYEGCGKVLVCPVCGDALQLGGPQVRSLVCSVGHSFDLAKQGYVNLYRGKPINEYTKESFQERQVILQRGMYAHLLEEICSFLRKTLESGMDSVEKKVLVDAGCGEGYYTREIAQQFDHLQLYGTDLSRDSIQLAAGTANGMGAGPAEIKWFVSDISKLPVADGSVDYVLDIFTSANYQEFQRVLGEEGYLIKIIPGEGHVKELREAAKDQLYHKEYKERKGAAVFAEQFELVEQKIVSRTFSVSPEERDIFIRMTPLLFAVDKSKIDWSTVTEITVEGELLIGKKKR